MIKFIVNRLGGIFVLQRKIRNTNGILQKGLRKFIYRPLYDKYLEQMGSFIGIKTQFSDTPILPHNLLGIFISNEAVIGKNVVIFHHVTIGSNNLSDSKSKGAPIIGDNCYIGAGAKIIGNVTVGNNVRIGANCVVVKDIPDNTVVVSQSARFILKDGKIDNTFVPI